MKTNTPSRRLNSRFPWLSGLVGLLLGSSTCFGLWFAGVEPPGTWRGGNRSAQQVSVAQSPALPVPLPSRKSSEPASHPSEKLQAAFRRAADLIERQRYAEALEVLNAVRGVANDATADEILRTGWAQGISLCQVEEILGNAHYLSPKYRDPAQAVRCLLSDHERLTETLDAVRARLNKASHRPRWASVVEELDSLLRDKELLERQVTQLRTALQEAEHEAKAASQRNRDKPIP
jgi:hypothetical protein